MPTHTAQSGSFLSYTVPAIVIAVVFVLRWRRMSRVTPLRLERLWIFPALYACIAVALFAGAPPAGWGWLFCLAALAAGAALGWQRGKLMRITIDPVTHQLNQAGSPAALLLIAVLVVVRTGARAALTEDNMLHLNALAVTDMLVAFSLGLFAVQRLEMYLRATKLLAGRA